MSSLSSRIDSILGSNYFLSPVWALRTSAALGLLTLLLGELVFVKGFAHGICLGLALGQFWFILTSSFQISRIESRMAERGEPQRLGLIS